MTRRNRPSHLQRRVPHGEAARSVAPIPSAEQDFRAVDHRLRPMSVRHRLAVPAEHADALASKYPHFAGGGRPPSS
jgi:hypothetical protein